MKKTKSYLIWAVVVCVFSFYAYRLTYRVARNHLLKTGTIHKRAIIIDEKNYMGNSPVSHEYSYSYTFTVNGKTYNNDSQNSDLIVGDSIEIEYAKNWPSVNKPVISTK